MDIVKIDLADRRRVRDFLDLPSRVYRDIPQWVPPLRMDERQRLDPRRYPFYRHSAAAFYLAYRDGQAVGRLAVLDNRRYNEFNRTQAAFFYLFECLPDPEAARGLFAAACAWARERGLTQVLGPKGFTTLDGFGLLVKGFEHRPAFGLPYNPSYYVDLIEAQGFRMTGESVSGYMGPENVRFPERIHALAGRIAERRGLRIARFRTRRELRSMIPYLKELYNGALEGTSGTVPLTDEEVRALAGQMLWFADPRLIKIVMKVADPCQGVEDPRQRVEGPRKGNEQAVGFLLAYPDISAALQKTKGRLFPFGWLALLRALRTTDWININGAGMIAEYRGLGGMAILYSEMFKSVTENPRYRHVDIVQIGTENAAMQREMENFGVDFYKTHRTYQLDL